MNKLTNKTNRLSALTKLKKIFAVLICVYIIVSNPIYYNKMIAFAETQQTEIEQSISENVDEQLGLLDTSAADALFADLNIDQNLIGGGSFSDKIKSIISGELAVDVGSLGQYFASVFLDGILQFLPYVGIIVALSVLFSILNSLDENKKGVKDVVHFVCYGAVVALIIGGIGSIVSLTTSTLTGIKTQMEVIFPLLLTVLTGIGGVSSVGIYQPAMAVLSGSIISIFINILLPIFTFKLIFNIISNLTNGIKLNKFADFFGSAFKWIMGIVLTVFSAVVSIQGLMAGSIDGVSIKTAKYTIKSSVPLIGGFLSDGVSLIMVSGSLIKNAIGVGGLVVMLCTIVLPLVKIIIFSFIMKFTSALLQPIGDSKICSFISDISKSVGHLIALLLGVAFMYFLIVGLVMCSANVL